MSPPFAWITGAHGFIGRHLARYLSTCGYQVAGIGHGTWPRMEAEGWGVMFWLNGDISISNLGEMRNAMGVPDLVFHLAGGSSVGSALAHPREDFSRTVVSTGELLEWVRQASPSTGIVAVSSAAVYGASHEGNIAESIRPTPLSPYGAHKHMMEELCRSYASNFGLRVVLPRLFSVYGVSLRKQLLWDLCGKLAMGCDVQLGGSGNELRDWIDVRDVVRALEKLAVLASVDAPAVNVATGEGVSVRDVATTVTECWRAVTGTAHEVSFSGESRPGDPFSLVADVSRMHALGIEPRISLENGVADYVDWYCHQKGGQ